MNKCLSRVLGGVACTIGVLALSMGIAHAEEKDQGPKLDVRVTVKAKAKSNATAPRVKVTVPRAKAQVRSTSRPAVRVKARANTRPRTIARVSVRSRATVQSRPAVRVRASVVKSRPTARVRANVRVNKRPAVRVKANPVKSRPTARVRANAVHRTSVKSTASIKAKRLSTARRDTAAERTPSVKADANAKVAGIPVDSCVRINAGNCADTGSGAPNNGSSGSNTVVPVITGDAKATVHDLVDGMVCLRINAVDCGDRDGGDGGTGGGGSNDTTGLIVPSVIGDANAEVADIPVDACVRVNAGDCAGVGAGTPNAGFPVIAGDATATVSDLADGVVCLRVNGDACGDRDGGTGSGDTTGSVVPSVIADADARVADIPVNACVRLNAGDCGTESDPGNDSDPNPSLPMIGADLTATATAGDVSVAGICLRINGGDCGISDSSEGPGTGGGASGGGDSDGVGSGDGDSDTPGPGRDGSAGNGSGGDGSVGGTFGEATPVATLRGIIRFSDGVLPDHLVGGNVQPVSSPLARYRAGDQKGSRLAHTGSSAAMLGLLVGGLLSLLMAGPLLARRRRN